MRCLVCGFEVKRPDATMCPNCGWTLARPADPDGSVSPTPIQPPSPPMSPPPDANQLDATAAPPAVSAPARARAPEAAPGAPPASGPAEAPGVPLSPYGWPAPPSIPYGAPGYVPPPGYAGYGQSMPLGAPYGAPPTYPLPAGAPPSMPYGAPYPGYPTGVPFPGYPGGMPPGPPPPPRMRRVGLIVTGSIAAVLIVLVASCGALYALVPQVRALVTGGSPTATTTTPGSGGPTVSPSTQTGAVIFQDSLTDATSGWSNVTNECFYRSDGYHIVNAYVCYAPAGVQTDVDVSVHVEQLTGATDHAFGIALRATPRVSHYDFVVTANSAWGFFKCVNATRTCSPIVDYTDSTAIHGGLHVSNVLRVRAVGSHFTFYANGTQVGQAIDDSFPSGYLGLRVNEDMECVFTNFVAARPS